MSAVLLLSVVVCSQIAGCSGATLVAAAAAAMIGIVQGNEVLAPYFGLLGF